MEKRLSEMTIEELWRLFPIILTAHQLCWKGWYEEELCSLQKLLPMTDVTRISHIGSTTVSTIWAKPIIDILVETKQTCDWNIIESILTGNCYICMSENDNRLSFNKGYTEKGFAEKVYHLHLRLFGDNDELYFRDYLIDHPQVAKEYEVLKRGLWQKYTHNRDAYTANKTDFVKKYTAKAKKLYGKRY